MKHIHTSDPVEVSGKEAAAFIIETLADEVDQRFGWQSDLEVGATMACWPGPMLPTLRLSRTSQLAHAIRASSLIDEAALPPIFDKCSVVLSLEDETAARDAYWEAVSLGGVVPEGSTERTEKQLEALATAAARSGAAVRVGHTVGQAHALQRVAQLGPLHGAPGAVERVADHARRHGVAGGDDAQDAFPRAERRALDGEGAVGAWQGYTASDSWGTPRGERPIAPTV